MASAQNFTESGFKCGKCRCTILVDNENQMLVGNPESVENLKHKKESASALWHLKTDGLPDWVTDAIDQVIINYNLKACTHNRFLLRFKLLDSLCSIIYCQFLFIVKLDQREAALSKLSN